MSDTESPKLSESSGEGSHYSSQETEIGCGTDLESQSESSSETETSMPGPYSFEPSNTDSVSLSDGSDTAIDDDDDERLTDLSGEKSKLYRMCHTDKLCRCVCSHCSIMATSIKRVCCREISTIVAKVDELGDTSVLCITQHPGFQSVCLDVWVLQTAYFQYRQEYGIPSSMISMQE